jgi:hypothetical protein
LHFGDLADLEYLYGQNGKMAQNDAAAALAKRLEAHREWLTSGGIQGERADFSGESLKGMDLAGAVLMDANFEKSNLDGADLRGANLAIANLRQATLRSANLQGANLQNADLSGATLHRADLRAAVLQNANLAQASLIHANLEGADLRQADLQGASLSGADLSEADLTGCDLRQTNLSGTNLADDIPPFPQEPKLRSADAPSVEPAIRLSQEPADNRKSVRRARLGLRSFAVAGVAALLLSAGAVYFFEDLRSLPGLEAFPGALAAIGLGDSTAASSKPAPRTGTVALELPKPVPQPKQGSRPQIEVALNPDATELGAPASGVAAPAAVPVAKEPAGQGAGSRVVTNARRAAEAKWKEQALVRRRAEEKARLEAVEKKSAKNLARRHADDRAKIEDRAGAIRQAERAARVRADQAYTEAAQAQQTRGNEESIARRNIIEAVGLEIEAKAARQEAEKAQQAGRDAVVRNDAEAWRRSEDEVDRYLEQATMLETEAEARRRDEKIAQGRAEEAAQRMTAAAARARAEEAEAGRLAADAARFEAEVEAAQRLETVARRMAMIEAINDWYLVRRSASVRSGPATDTEQIGSLKHGTNILVTGKITDANWYRVRFGDGDIGYVFGTSLEKE